LFYDLITAPAVLNETELSRHVSSTSAYTCDRRYVVYVYSVARHCFECKLLSVINIALTFECYHCC